MDSLFSLTLGVIREPSFEVTPPRDCAVFYSGVDRSVSREAEIAGGSISLAGHTFSGPNWQLAAFVSSGARFVTLESTPGGRWLQAQDLSALSPEERSALWSEASDKYARAASGNVTAYIEGAESSRVFMTTELPALLRNPRVTSINTMNMEVFRLVAASQPGGEGVALVYDLLRNPSRFADLEQRIVERQGEGLDPLPLPRGDYRDGGIAQPRSRAA